MLLLLILKCAKTPETPEMYLQCFRRPQNKEDKVKRLGIETKVVHVQKILIYVINYTPEIQLHLRERCTSMTNMATLETLEGENPNPT